MLTDLDETTPWMPLDLAETLPWPRLDECEIGNGCDTRSVLESSPATDVAAVSRGGDGSFSEEH